MRIKVVFLTFYYEAWDALAGVYELMRKDSRFDVKVVAVSRKLTGGAGFDDASGVSAFFDLPFAIPPRQVSGYWPRCLRSLLLSAIGSRAG